MNKYYKNIKFQKYIGNLKNFKTFKEYLQVYTAASMKIKKNCFRKRMYFKIVSFFDCSKRKNIGNIKN